MHTYKMCALAIAAAFPLAAQAALTVSFKAPVSGATVSGTLQGAACEATGTEIRRVRFSVDGTALNEDSKSPWSCVLDTTTLANGQHTLMATAFGRKGDSTTTQVIINVENAAPPPPPPPPPPAPSTGPSAVPTFESLGLYWKPGSDPGAAGCSVRYRKSGDVEWKDGLNLWYDARNGECRGSLVHLAPGTTYEFELAAAGQAAASGSAKTWSENFPIARVVEVPSGSATLAITEGGTPEGYVLYTSPAGTRSTLDVANMHDFNVTISAPYVIVRGLTLRGAKQDGIRLLAGAHDVVIEDNDISGWGRYRATLSNGWQVGMEKDSAVRARCYDFPAGVTLER
ncbi:MAG TPA: Ig-like domain-containing protein, partial [Vicinamibacterales bacterium]|nr:Ig-like domain-containing protein [Vicinamibacterales bacterium]